MNSSVLDIEKLCRTCLKEEEQSVSLFNVDLNSGIQPVEMFYKCFANIQIFEKDQLPKSICSNCYYKLGEAYQFKLQVDQMDIKLRHYLEENEKKKSAMEMNSGEDAEIRAAMDELFGDEQQIHTLDNQLYQVSILDQVKNDLVNMDNLDLILNDNKTEKVTPKKKLKKSDSKVTKKSKPIKCKSKLDELLKNHKEKMREENMKFKKIFKQKRKKKLTPLREPEQCTKCGKVFNYKGYMEIHLRSHQNLRPFECHICHRTFSQNNNLKLHLRTHSGIKPFQCEKCSKLFSTSSNLSAHLKIHSDVKPFKCNECPRTFISQTLLQSHSGTHTGVKNVVCKICKKAFYKTSYLNLHIKNIHQGLKKYQCSDCNKLFANSSNLICHRRIHSGEKPFVCQTCGAKFNQSSSLARHAKLHNKPNFKSSKTISESTKSAAEKRKGSEAKSLQSEEPSNIASIPQEIPQQHVTSEFRIESVLDLQETANYSEENRVQSEEPHLNMSLQPIESISHTHHSETIHQDQYQSSLLPDPLNLINSNTSSNTYSSLALPPPTASSFNYDTHHFNYDTSTTNYLPTNSFNFIDFSKPTNPVVPQSTPQLPMINQNFDFSKMLPPPLPANNFIPGGLDFSKNSLNGQPTYIDY